MKGNIFIEIESRLAHCGGITENKSSFMESISNVKQATKLEKKAKKVQRQKSFFLHKYHIVLFSAMATWDSEHL